MKVVLVAVLLSTLIGSCYQCPPATCNRSQLDPFVYCIEDKNCSIDGQVVTSCTIGGWLNCRLYYLGRDEVLAIPVERMWRNAQGNTGTLRDLEITGKGPDLRTMTVTLDDRPVACTGSANKVVCWGLDATTHVLKLTNPGPGAIVALDMVLRDQSCKYVCPI